MEKLIHGIHHVTALASDPQRNVDFYAGILGLRLVKKTVNFDAPDVYHLYYGNQEGSPGTLLTFFPYPGLAKGRKGKGQLTVISFSVAKNALDYWFKRLERFGIPSQGIEQRFDESFMYFEDPDGLGLEIIGTDRDDRIGCTHGNVPGTMAIKGFYGITLSEECDEKTAHLLKEQMGYTLLAKSGNRNRHSITGIPGDFVDVLCTPDLLMGASGSGTVHHVAFATANDQTQKIARENLLKYGLNVTPMLDRQYFHSIYFKEPGGVLFEIATVPPGFAIDESPAHLGESLKLPPWQERNRSFIESSLPPLHVDQPRFTD